MHANKRSSVNTVRTLRWYGRETDPVFLRDPKQGNVLVMLLGFFSPFKDILFAVQDVDEFIKNDQQL